MGAKLLLLALCTGFGLGCLLLAFRSLARVARLVVRGLLTQGVVTPRRPSDGRRGGLVEFPDSLGRTFVFDPGWYGALCGLPAIGGPVRVVYLRNRPSTARLWLTRHLLGPSFGWFLSSSLVFALGTRLVS
ncbi:DUF3592 domain-containing protein [Streptomyces sp. NPDC050560]|uniref:DUF3592 domain-containing protein n=1 Tax=Streptomyces sp. NPDC050560 TaxID=3365630 RepID=UPI0037976DD8